MSDAITRSFVVAGTAAVFAGAAFVFGVDTGLVAVDTSVPLAGVLAVFGLLCVAVWHTATAAPVRPPLSEREVERVADTPVLGETLTDAVEAGAADTVAAKLTDIVTTTLSIRTGADEATCGRAIETGSWTTDQVAAATVSDKQFPLRHRVYSGLFPRRALEQRVERTASAVEVIDETAIEEVVTETADSSSKATPEGSEQTRADTKPPEPDVGTVDVAIATGDADDQARSDRATDGSTAETEAANPQDRQSFSHGSTDTTVGRNDD